MFTKKCSKCEEVKSIDNFYKNKTSKDKLYGECKKCNNKRTAEYFKFTEYRKKWTKANPNYFKEYDKKRLPQDPSYKISKNLRRRLNHILRENFKVGSAVKDLGCTGEQLKLHLEKRFKDGMSWNNYGCKLGQWSIDHIIPLSKVDLTDRNEFLKVCHFTNLQPLWHWGKDGNVEKRNKC